MNKLLKTGFAICFTFLLSYCTAVNNFQKGEVAFKLENWDAAIEFYHKALQDDPKNPRIRLSLAKSYVFASRYHYELGEELYKKGDKKLALIEFQKSLDIYPENHKARLKKNEILRESAILKEKLQEQSELELIPESEIKNKLLSPDLKVDSEKKFDLKFRDAWLYDIFNVLQKIGGINIILDEQVTNKQVSIEYTDVTFIQALENLTLSHSLYYKIIGDKNIILIPEIPQKRNHYDELIVKTFYPSHVNVQELVGYLKIITNIDAIATNSVLNTVTLRDTLGRIEIAQRLIKALDKPRGDVLVDIEIIEVNKSRMKEYGLDLSNYQLAANVVSEDDALDPGLIYGDELLELNSANILFSLPSMIYKLMSSDVKSKIIANPQIRVKSDEKATVRIGDKVPVPTTTFVPFATGGVSQQPITSFTYENVGINIDLIPTIHMDNTITLEITFELTFITGPVSAANPPIIGNRSVTSIIRLRDGDTNLLAGLLRDEERKSLKGIPGIVNIPILRSLFGANTREISQTDIILSITPRVLSYPSITESDISALWVGPESNLLLKSLIQHNEREKNNEIENFEREELKIGFIPQNSTVVSETNFTVGLYVDNLNDVEIADLKIHYNPSLVHLLDIEGEEFLKLNNAEITEKSIDNQNGFSLISIKVRQGLANLEKRSLLKIHFNALRKGKMLLDLSGTKIHSSSGNEIPIRLNSGEVTISDI